MLLLAAVLNRRYPPPSPADTPGEFVRENTPPRMEIVRIQDSFTNRTTPMDEPESLDPPVIFFPEPNESDG